MKELTASQTEDVTGARLIKRPPITTLAVGEEGGGVTTLAIGEEGGSTRKLGEEGPIYTTLALGEEGSPPVDATATTTSALGSF
jgi:hypothetical protein